ncbi:MAG: SGNH/GDSL hydrolase family protein [Clostridia bacterium]|nr:SGNH/GDSL hydrolase family protein [Clostridia bacterium]
MKRVIVCIGDSLTEGDYGIKGQRGIGNVQEKNYPYFLEKIMDCEARNFGKCGYTATKYLEFYKKGNVRLCSADDIVVMLGTNGGHDPEVETQGNRDYEELISLLRHDAPDAEIHICTPPHVTENTEYSNCGYAERVEKAVKWIRNYAENEKIDLIDTANAPAFTAETEHIMQPNDGLHFGEEGYKALAEFIAEHLK